MLLSDLLAQRSNITLLNHRLRLSSLSKKSNRSITAMHTLLSDIFQSTLSFAR